MKINEKLTEDVVKDFLESVGFQKTKRGQFWCFESEQYINIHLSGNQIKDLLDFIKNHYYSLGYDCGYRRGSWNKIKEIKDILEL